MDDYPQPQQPQQPQWPPTPTPQPDYGQGATLPAADPPGAWPAAPDGASPAPFAVNPMPGGEATNPSWYGEPAYSPPPPAYSPPLGYSPPPPPAYPPPPPMPSQPLGGYPTPAMPPYGRPSMPLYGQPSMPQSYAPSQPLGGYAPPMGTGYGQTGYPQPGYPPPGPGYGYPVQPVVMVAQPRGSTGGAVAVEAILAFFGLYGVGWLMAGETTVGVVLLLASFFWWGLAIIIAAATLGLGLFCVAPINIGLMILSAALLANHTRQ